MIVTRKNGEGYLEGSVGCGCFISGKESGLADDINEYAASAARAGEVPCGGVGIIKVPNGF